MTCVGSIISAKLLRYIDTKQDQSLEGLKRGQLKYERSMHCWPDYVTSLINRSSFNPEHAYNMYVPSHCSVTLPSEN